MFDNRNTSKFAIALVVLISAVGIGAVGAAAQMDSPTLVDNETVTPTNETESVYVDATGVDDFNGSAPVNVTVTIEGLAEGESVGNGTTVDTDTISVSEGNVSSYDYALTDADRDYDELVVTAEVETDGDESLIASVDWGTLEQVAGGGTGGLGSIGGVPIIAIAALGGAYLIFVRD
jgi:ABC-type oligopeptide transport system substrate-binding subunit